MIRETIRNLNEYILKVESEISDIKKRNRHYFYEFDIPFETQAMGNNFKIYFLSKGYEVDIKWCKQCLNNVAAEIIIKF